MTPADLERLAEACDRAAEEARSRMCCTDWPRAVWCNDCTQDDECSELLARHARALRAGRVTVTEETNG